MRFFTIHQPPSSLLYGSCHKTVTDRGRLYPTTLLLPLRALSHGKACFTESQDYRSHDFFSSGKNHCNSGNQTNNR